MPRAQPRLWFSLRCVGSITCGTLNMRIPEVVVCRVYLRSWVSRAALAPWPAARSTRVGWRQWRAACESPPHVSSRVNPSPITGGALYTNRAQVAACLAQPPASCFVAQHRRRSRRGLHALRDVEQGRRRALHTT